MTLREGGSLAAQPHNGGRFAVARTPPGRPGFDFLGPLRSSPAVLGGALSHWRFPPPSLGSRKTRSEPAPLGGACSVASRFSSLVGSSSATPASAAAAAAPLGSQILQRRPRAFPLPRYTPAPLRPGPLAFRGPRCAEREPRPERPSTRPPPPAAGFAAGPGRARERSPGGRRPRRRAARGGAGGPGRGGGPGPGAVVRDAAAAASGLRSLCTARARVGWVAGRGPRPSAPSPGLARPRGAPRGPGRPVGPRPSSVLRARPLAAPRPGRRRPSPRPEAPRGHHAGAAAAVRVFQRGERTQVAGAAGASAEKGEERAGPRFPACSPCEGAGPEKGWGGGARAGPSFFPVSPPPRKDGAH